MRKTFLFLSFATILISSAASVADDVISVTINGRSYTCGSGGGDFIYSCQCVATGGGYYWLEYDKSNRATGSTSQVDILQYFQAKDASLNAKNCETSKAATAVCNAR